MTREAFAPDRLDALVVVGMATAASAQTLNIGAIPDQDVSVLNRMFGLFADYLSEETGLAVRYVPSTDYAALVTAFRRGDIHLAWFGGLTGVQAQAVAPGAEAFAQRPRDAEFTPSLSSKPISTSTISPTSKVSHSPLAARARPRAIHAALLLDAGRRRP